MHRRTTLLPLASLVGLLLPACDNRQDVMHVSGSGSTTSTGASTTSSTSTGMGGADACANLTVSSPFTAANDDLGASRARPVQATDNGREVSILYATPSATMLEHHALRTVTLEPWDAWPPAIGSDFQIDETGGDEFSVAKSEFSKVNILTHRVGTDYGEGPYFMPDLTTTQPAGLFFAPAGTGELNADTHASLVVQGYEHPPIATNYGFPQALMALDTRASGTTHAMLYGVSSGALYWLTSSVFPPDTDPALACANAPMAIDGARVGAGWLIAVASGAPLEHCGESAAQAPTDLAIDRIAWGPKDSVSWTLDRPTTLSGDAPLTRIQIAGTDVGAWIVDQRENEPPELIRADGEGIASKPIALDSADTFAVAALGRQERALVAIASGGESATVALELRDADGSKHTSTTFDPGGSVEDLRALTSVDGTSALLTWTSKGTLRVARVSCEVGQ